MTVAHIVLSGLLLMAAHGPTFAQGNCPTRYSKEQINLIKHSAFITAAQQYCPSLKGSMKPLLSYLAEAWGGAPPDPDEFECSIWKDTFDQATGSASQQIATYGLKRFCEASVGMYGPSGSLAKNALTFSE